MLKFSVLVVTLPQRYC